MTQHAAAIERINYYGDSRVREAMRTRYFEVIAVHGGIAIVQLTDNAVEMLTDEGDEERPEWFPVDHTGAFHASCLSENCYQCDGKGTTVNPSIDAGGISSDDEFWDDDIDDYGESRYMSGMYDITCSACNGTKLCQDIQFVDERVEEWMREMEQDAADDDAERLAELRMGC